MLINLVDITCCLLGINLSLPSLLHTHELKCLTMQPHVAVKLDGIAQITTQNRGKVYILGRIKKNGVPKGHRRENRDIILKGGVS